VVQFNKEASQARDYSVAQSATVRAARPDPLRLRSGQALAAQRTLAGDDKSNCTTTVWVQSMY